MDLMSFILLWAGLMKVAEASIAQFSQLGASAPGNIIIGGLFPIHEAVVPVNYTGNNSISAPEHPDCIRFYTKGLNQALAMINAVEMANKSPMLSSLNITLGYRIYDTCSDVTTALRAVHDIMRPFSDCESPEDSSQPVQPIMAVIGTTSSEISIAVARDLNLQMIPQISYASTATILSDKSRFPAFMRTVPSDEYQTCAMAKLLKSNKWSWVGIIITDGDYGRSALEGFIQHTETEGICIAFKAILPDSLADQQKLNTDIENTLNIIENNPKVRVVISFAKSSQMQLLFKGLQSRNISNNMVWVASDNWSTAKHILNDGSITDIGKVLGFTFKSGNFTSFHQYLKNLQFESEDEMNNSFLKEFLKLNAGNASNTVLELMKSTNLDKIFSIEMAVTAVANAVAKLCAERQCQDSTALQPWELLRQLRSITFENGGEMYKFDANGDINLGYDLFLWEGDQSDEHADDIIAEYDPTKGGFHYIHNDLSEIKKVVSRCSNSCQPGQYKKTAEGQHTCCYECLTCVENHYSNITDADECSPCDSESMWSLANSTECHPKVFEYFDWNSGFAIVLLILAALGVLLLFFMSALFFWQRHSPVVKAAGGPLCHLILVSLLGSFISVVFFVGEPSDLTCRARQVIFGFSFTLCVSCILVKSLKILLAFEMNFELKELLCMLYKPYMIVSVGMGVQIIICTVWLTLYKPFKDKEVQTESILLECNEGFYVMFWLMLGYIALLALFCFTFAYIGRKLPQKYNEAKFITFSMVICLMAWIIFIPIHVTTSGKYVPAVEMVVILISNYGILSCHFLPKSYIILFKKEHNTKDAFMKNVYEYARKSAENIKGLTGTEPQFKQENSVYTISNLSFVPEEKHE
ncbi:G-protein coupled receptor family C group 6 member A precursor [Danio rerio]|uniref:G-protein coupled receptor family C group 6 member A n=2 Tax=Danio rerio TaxID=7955 RepID=GPC6A_DANRE|nr:G-protein coupled receptor family C group 6 member A precursor [Danio rerio]Q5U9X3.1 RecName: Full=G-protein coupled receptor family C group 6 member A; AltName: Full=Odorant receptor ZO6; Flags: Precursor [Danio rerio]AAI63268.1 G protein-coupled receptor, family C, group 6, member A [Danio rerio]AAI63279.1 G protein-coupled receptor, family C, group 6, member A [Danio rerio]AAV51935.1 odorant receptor ZO6 [Danio rerio]|eukprot:NP_001008731.1 G-protein coupled receptor family C group 6 member A precursor [Danio rerio]